MFDDPKKDLKWLEQQLLAQEQSQEESEEEDWLELELQEAYTLLKPQHRNQPEDVFRFLEEDTEEEDTEEEDTEEEEVPTVPSRGRRYKRKEKGLGGLVFLACAEMLAIAALLIWWALWLL